MEYLSQVLSQRGPQAVPYDEGSKWTIREHLSELLKVRRRVGPCGAGEGGVENRVKELLLLS